MSCLFTASQLDTQSMAELYPQIVDALYFNDYDWQQEEPNQIDSPALCRGAGATALFVPSATRSLPCAPKVARCGVRIAGMRLTWMNMGFSQQQKMTTFLSKHRPNGIPGRKTSIGARLVSTSAYSEPCRLFRISDAGSILPVGEGTFYSLAGHVRVQRHLRGTRYRLHDQ